MAYPIQITWALADDNSIASDQAFVADEPLLLNYPTGSNGIQDIWNGVPVGQNIARSLQFHSADNITAITFTVVGLLYDGVQTTETVTGINNSRVQTTKHYIKVLSITPDTTSGVGETVEVGLGNAGETIPAIIDYHKGNFNVSIEVNVTGTVSWTPQQTSTFLQKPTANGMQTTPLADVHWNSLSFFTNPSAVVPTLPLTADAVVHTETPCQAVRVAFTGTTGNAIITIIQQGIW